MSRLVSKLLIDEDLPELLAELLRKEGADAVTVREIRMGGALDLALLVFAKQQQRIFVTHNKTEIIALARQILNHAGIIVVQGTVRLASCKKLSEQILDKITKAGDWTDVIDWVYV